MIQVATGDQSANYLHVLRRPRRGNCQECLGQDFETDNNITAIKHKRSKENILLLVSG